MKEKNNSLLKTNTHVYTCIFIKDITVTLNQALHIQCSFHLLLCLVCPGLCSFWSTSLRKSVEMPLRDQKMRGVRRHRVTGCKDVCLVAENERRLWYWPVVSEIFILHIPPFLTSPRASPPKLLHAATPKPLESFVESALMLPHCLCRIW